jgi:hypothetical protein
LPLVDDRRCGLNGTGASRSAVGGAATAGGEAYRAAVAAFLGAHALRGWEIGGLELPREAAVPLDLRLETDEALDDIGCSLRGGGTLCIQAKHTLKLGTRPGSPFAAAVAQCCAAVRKGGLDPDRDRLAIVTAAPSGPIEYLSDALCRRRNVIGGRPTTAEAAALKKLESLLGDLDDEQRALLLDCLVILRCEPGERGLRDAQLAGLLLDGAIVTHGSGPAAFEALRSKALDLARLRQGFNVAGLLTALSEAGLQLSGEADGSAALRLVARQAAATTYRQRLQEDGETIRLLGVGAGLPRLVLTDLDAEVKAIEPGLEKEKPSERPLSLLVRRRGRLLLTGLPGSGKSTAMRQAAGEQAGTPDAPLPLFIDLKLLARRLDSEPVVDAVVEVVCAKMRNDERAALREEILGALARGEVTLYLDALDETRGMKERVVEAIDDLLNGYDESVEVVVATRDSAAAAGRMLGFGEARLVAPGEVKKTVRAILRAFAGHRCIEDPEDWVRPRMRWVERVLSRDPDLSKTPLMPILLAVSAGAHADLAELPTLRAEILEGVVRDVVERWESARAASGVVELGALSGARAAEALFGCFVREGSLLAGEPLAPEMAVRAALAECLADHWGLGGADATATGREAIEFWDEAGFFLKTPEGRIEARVRLFGELADALHRVAGDDGALRSWVAGNVSDPERVESLKLAAGLSVTGSRTLVEEAVRDGRLQALRTALEAIDEGASATPELIAALIGSLLAILRRGGEEGVDAAAFLADLPVPADLQDEIFEAFSASLPADHALVAEVRAIFGWKMERTSAVLDRLRLILRTESPKALGRSEASRPNVIAILGVDRRWGDAVSAAADALVAESETEARIAAELIGKTGMSHSQRIKDALRRAGYDDLVREQDEKTRKETREALDRGPDWKERMRRSSETETIFLEAIAALAPPGPIGIRERRSLDELVDFYYTLGVPESYGGEADGLAHDVPEALRLYVESVAALSDFDLPKLAAEAAFALEKFTVDDGTSSLLYIPGKPREVADWSRVTDPERMRDGLIRLLKTVRFVAHTAAWALLRAPADLKVVEAIRTSLPKPGTWRRHLAVLVVLDALPIEQALAQARIWSEDPDPFTRAAVAFYAAILVGTGSEDDDLLVRALRDHDGEVRDEALVKLKGKELGPDLRKAVTAAAEGPLPDWTCSRCATLSPGQQHSCGQCKTVGPELKRHAGEILAG